MIDHIGKPVPPMSAEAVLRTLAEDQPDALADALASADAHRETLVDPLLEALERGLADPLGASPEEASLFSYALYVLAKWREPRAYPYVIRWLSLAEEEPFDIAGDVVTQDGGRILAAVCDGHLEPITALIVNQQADEWVRSAGVDPDPIRCGRSVADRRSVANQISSGGHAGCRLRDASSRRGAEMMRPKFQVSFKKERKG